MYGKGLWLLVKEEWEPWLPSEKVRGTLVLSGGDGLFISSWGMGYLFPAHDLLLSSWRGSCSEVGEAAGDLSGLQD